jgi:Carboxypeptidase regulatory-like domain
MESAIHNIWTRFLLAFVVLSLCAGASAQVSKGSISGTVVDPTGAIIAGAEVKAISADTNQAITTTSDDAGLFKLPLLPIGSYRVEISRAGFRKAALAGIGVTPGVDAGLGTIKLELGAATETVEVTAATPLIETTQAQITTTFDQTFLDNIPGIQENQGLDMLAPLLPGVSASRDANRANTNGTGFVVDGLRGRSNDQQIDGQYNNDNSVTGPAIFVGDSEFVNQYQITTNNFGAEYGRNAGSVVNISTKSGSNTWHGSVYGTESNSKLTTLTNQEKNTVWGEGLIKPPHFNDQFAGATIGGPWVKNKIFFFGGFDEEIFFQKGVLASGSLTPDPTGIGQLASCYPGSPSIAALQAFGPFAVGGGNPTPLGAPVLVGGNTKYPNGYPSYGYAGFVPNNVDGTCHTELSGVQRTLGDGDHQYDWISRLDVTGAKDTVYVRYIFQKLTFFNVDEGQGPAGYPVNVPSLGQDLGVSWTHKLSDRMLNEVRAAIGRQNVQFGGNGIGNTVPTQNQVESALANISLTGPSALGTPSSSSLLGYGPSTSFPQGRIVNTIQLQDNLSYVRGKHQFKAGFNYTFEKSPNVFLPNGNGAFQFKDWGAYAADVPTATSITLGTPKLDFLEHDSFFYFGDDWKITSHLTLNLGLTYSYYGQPANLFNNNDSKQQSSSAPFWNPSLPTSVTVFPSLPAPKNSWGPNIGFAYAVGNGGWLMGDNKTVFRGGYRLAYDPPYYNIYLNIASSAPQVLAQTIRPGQPLLASPFGPANRAELAPFLTLGVSDPRKFNQTSVAPNFKPDRVHSWSFGIQRELGNHAAAEVRYVGNHAVNLFQSINGNPYIADLAQGISDGVFKASLLPAGDTPCPASSAIVPSATGRVNCNEGVLRERTNTGYSDYNGLQMELRTTNLFNQLTLKTNYTWSKTTDNTSEIFGTLSGANTFAFSQDPLNNTTAEHGISGQDFPNTWTVSFNEAIPFFKSQQGFIGHMFGGWSVAGTYILQSGQAYTPGEFFSAYALSPYNTSDLTFLSAFNSGSDTARPFVSNLSAPATAIGIYGADVCGFGGGLDSMGNCTLTANGLYDYTAFNSTGAINPVSAKQEHFILNAFEAQTINGTPFGNAARNSLRDFKTNTANLQIAKTSNWGERVRIVWHMSLVNAFNHPNYNTIDPFIEDAGLVQLGTGFANPSVQNGGNRTIRFGVKVAF